MLVFCTIGQHRNLTGIIKTYRLFYIQLFRERLSYKRGKAYATMSKVIVDNGGFYGCFKVFQRGGRKKHNHAHSFFLDPFSLNHLEPHSSKTKLLRPIMPIAMVAYAFTNLWNNLCRNSCIHMQFSMPF